MGPNPRHWLTAQCNTRTIAIFRYLMNLDPGSADSSPSSVPRSGEYACQYEMNNCSAAVGFVAPTLCLEKLQNVSRAPV